MHRAKPQDTRSLVDDGVVVTRPVTDEQAGILSTEAMRFVADLVRRFRGTRNELLKLRAIRQREIDAGRFPDFLRHTVAIRNSEWTADPIPDDLHHQHLDIAVASDRRSLFEALATPSRAIVADFEDATSPTWFNCTEGQVNVRDAVHAGRAPATLLVRPRGLHLDERHVRIDDEPAPAFLVDTGLFLFHNAAALRAAGKTVCLHLPKLESHLEARLWSDVFARAEEVLGLARWSIRAIVLVETILAAFEMDEILYELRHCTAGLDCGRWDYIFSLVKRLRNHSRFVLPDRNRVTAGWRPMRACSQLMVFTCRRRGVPLWCGADGLGEGAVTAHDLLAIPHGDVTEAGLRNNVRVAVTYLESWLHGDGYVSIDGAMEDTATAEISRAQVWQWVRHGVRLTDGRTVTASLVRQIIDEELVRMAATIEQPPEKGRFDLAVKLFVELVETDDFPESMTVPAYDYLD
jgi:malate synthase